MRGKGDDCVCVCVCVYSAPREEKKLLQTGPFLTLSLSSKKLEPNKVSNNKLQTSTMYLKT